MPKLNYSRTTKGDLTTINTKVRMYVTSQERASRTSPSSQESMSITPSSSLLTPSEVVSAS